MGPVQFNNRQILQYGACTTTSTTFNISYKSKVYITDCLYDANSGSNNAGHQIKSYTVSGFTRAANNYPVMWMAIGY